MNCHIKKLNQLKFQQTNSHLQPYEQTTNRTRQHSVL
jgi:hypothetical protein